MHWPIFPAAAAQFIAAFGLNNNNEPILDTGLVSLGGQLWLLHPRQLRGLWHLCHHRTGDGVQTIAQQCHQSNNAWLRL